MSFLWEHVRRGQSARWWHGLVYYDFIRDHVVTCPVPFNWLFRLALWMGWKIRYTKWLDVVDNLRDTRDDS